MPVVNPGVPSVGRWPGVRRLGRRLAGLAGLRQPWFSGHRGGLGEAVSPENTVASFQAGADAGVAIMDGGDVRMGADGTLFCNHGTTVDSLTTGTGLVSSFDAAGWAALVADVSNWSPPFSGWADTRLATFEEVLQIASTQGEVVLTVENKDQGDQVTVQAMVDAIVAHGLQDRVLFMSFNDADFAIPSAAGIATGKIASGSQPTAASLLALPVDYFIYDYTNTVDFTPAYLQGLYDAGLKLSPWTLLRRADRDAESIRVGRPLAGMTGSDSQWLAETNEYLSSDPYATQKWWSGAFSNAGFRPGVFRAGGKWGFDGSSSCLQGWGSRDTPHQQSIEFTLTLENNVVTTTRYVALNFWATDDRNFGIGRGTGNDALGYQLRIRQDGVAQLYRADQASLIQIGTDMTTAALTAGVDSVWKVEDVGAGQIRVSRDGTALQTVADATYRGGYFSFAESDGGEGLQSSFRAVTLTDTAPPPAGGGTYNDEVLADAPVNYWKLDETAGTAAADSAGTNDGTYDAGVLLGEPGLLVGDDGTSAYFDDASVVSGAYPAVTYPLTVEAWVQLDATPAPTGHEVVFALADAAGTTNRWAFAVRRSTVHTLAFWEISNSWQDTGVEVSLGVPHHIVAVIEADTLTLYLDGAIVGTPFALGSVPTAAMTRFMIGGDPWTTADRVKGHIEKVAVYDTVLSAERVAAHYAAGS